MTLTALRATLVIAVGCPRRGGSERLKKNQLGLVMLRGFREFSITRGDSYFYFFETFSFIIFKIF